MRLEATNENGKVKVLIYDRIGNSDYDRGFSVDQLLGILENANGKDLEIHINSGGGDVFEGFAIYNALKNYKGQKTVFIDGICASIASVIMLSGDKVIMNKASMLMIHNASGVAWGKAEDLRRVAEALEKINEIVRSLYVGKSSLSLEEVTSLMDKETFIKPNEALAYGLIDEIVDGEKEDTTEAQQQLNNQIQANIETLQKLQKFNASLEDENSDEEINTEKQSTESAFSFANTFAYWLKKGE